MISSKPAGKCAIYLVLPVQLCDLYAQEIDSDVVNRLIAENTLEANQNMADLIIQGDIALLDSAIDVVSIALLDHDKLRILRNTIFARYGYSFRSEDLRNHFSQFDWYSPRSADVDSQLNGTDSNNIERIRSFERIDTEIETIVGENDLVGMWHAAQVVAAGYHSVFQFYSDGRFTFNYDQNRELPVILSFSGRYETRGNALLLFADSREMLAHSDQLELTGGMGYIWLETSIETEPYSGQFRFPISRLQRVGEIEYLSGFDWMQNRKVIEIGGRRLFHISDDPDDYS